MFDRIKDWFSVIQQNVAQAWSDVRQPAPLRKSRSHSPKSNDDILREPVQERPGPSIQANSSITAAQDSLVRPKQADVPAMRMPSQNQGQLKDGENFLLFDGETKWMNRILGGYGLEFTERYWSVRAMVIGDLPNDVSLTLFATGLYGKFSHEDKSVALRSTSKMLPMTSPRLGKTSFTYKHMDMYGPAWACLEKHGKSSTIAVMPFSNKSCFSCSKEIRDCLGILADFCFIGQASGELVQIQGDKLYMKFVTNARRLRTTQSKKMSQSQEVSPSSPKPGIQSSEQEDQETSMPGNPYNSINVAENASTPTTEGGKKVMPKKRRVAKDDSAPKFTDKKRKPNKKPTMVLPPPVDPDVAVDYRMPEWGKGRIRRRGPTLK